MAQPIQVSPIQVSSGDGLEYLGQSISSIIKASNEREKALRESILKQKEINQRIFGDTNSLLRDFNDKSSSLPIELRNSIFKNGINMLSKYVNDPNFPQMAQQIVAGAYQTYSGWNDYFNKSNQIAKDLADKYGMDEKSIKAFAYKNMYDYSGKEPILKNPTSLGDISKTLEDEVISHPELYTDQYKLTTGAYKNFDSIVGTPEKGGSDLSLDPTGKKVNKIGTDYTISKFDRLATKTEKYTGLNYQEPELSTENASSPSGGLYNVLSEDKFNIIKDGGNPILKQKIMIGAIEKIRQHNEEVFKKAGFRDAKTMALSVSKETVDNYKDLKGFVNPFDAASMDFFERAYAVDFIKQSGRYKPDGTVQDFKLQTNVKAESPKQTINVNVGPGMEKGYIDAYSQVEDVLASGAEKPLNELDQNIRTAILKIADESTVFRAGKKGKVIPEAITISKDDKGRNRIYMAGPDGKPVGDGVLFSAQSLNQMVNEGLSMKTKERATSESKPLQKVKTYKGLDKDGNPIFD